jgi:hypothetical protein
LRCVLHIALIVLYSSAGVVVPAAWCSPECSLGVVAAGVTDAAVALSLLLWLLLLLALRLMGQPYI